MAKQMTGAEMVIEALVDQGVEHIFGYPGGAVLPIYDAMFQQDKVQHILVRHEQGATHMAEGYARSTGKVGCVLVTSGPGRDQRGHRAHRRADGLDPDRLHHRPGADAADRLGRVPGMRHGRHHAPLHQAQLSRQERQRSGAGAARGVLHRGDRPAGAGGGRHPQGRAVRDGHLSRARGSASIKSYKPHLQGRPRRDQGRGRHDGEGRAADLLYRRRRHQFGAGGERAAARARAADRLSGDLDADGARRVPGGRSAMARHARHARHLRSQHGDARLRPDDLHRRAVRRPHHRPDRRVLARLAQDPRRHRSVLDQQERAGRPADRRRLRQVLEEMVRIWRADATQPRKEAIAPWWKQIDGWRARKSLAFRNSNDGDQAAVRDQAALRG